MVKIYEHSLLIFGDEKAGREIISLLINEMNLLATETNELSMSFADDLPTPSSKKLIELDKVMQNWYQRNQQSKIEDFSIYELGTSEEYCFVSFVSVNEHYAELVHQLSRIHKNSKFILDIYINGSIEITIEYKNGEKVPMKLVNNQKSLQCIKPPKYNMDAEDFLNTI
ncbi:hypothetical protein FOA22_03280 [Heyndrickxia oleronia]|uniref:hypothetical protein n=1 Tax=Heyndrickxia oleronia TaxID=38875 RepID=UPI00071713C0